MQAALIYPHQLFSQHPAARAGGICFLIEDPLFFTQYPFHRQKIMLHRASMKAYARELAGQKKQVVYVDSRELEQTGDIVPILQRYRIERVGYVDPSDDWLQRRLSRALTAAGLESEIFPDPHFLTQPRHFLDFEAKRKDKKGKWFFTDFYVEQRKRLGVLIDDKGKPLGGKWSFDTENRKKIPKGISIPGISWPDRRAEVNEAIRYADRHFSGHYGRTGGFCYPITAKDARGCLHDFLQHRFDRFGDYEDAMEPEETFLFHSVLTPALNTGLLSPQEVIDGALSHADRVPLNSLEGFIRQVIGWREYIRGVYLIMGRQQRTANFWGNQHAIPSCFYDGSTGIDPVDRVIRRVLDTGYCHHIERLMILGNFMLLCDFHPDAVYRWFMEMFIDAYDWVMVPNIYGMSQYADGGLITTKPYISGSAYVLKMSRFSRGEWCPIWDALYWRFIHRHREFFASNPRMSVMVAQLDRMGDKLTQHLKTAEGYLRRLQDDANHSD
jgi:deoxyribodipyrimidine photolyase-related protein